MRRAATVLSLAALAMLAATAAPSWAASRQFNTFTPATSQAPKVNPAVEMLETCEGCTPPTDLTWLRGARSPSLPAPLQDDVVGEDRTNLQATAFSTAPFSPNVSVDPQREPFELHPEVGWNVETEASGTGVYLKNGSLYRQEVDFEIPGRGFSFRFIRRHVSGIGYDGPLGHNWDFNYNMRIVVDGSGNAVLHDGTGRADTFTVSGGVYSTPAGRFEELTQSGAPAKFLLTTPHSTVYRFDATGTNCKLESITDRAGNVMTFSYDVSGRLATVTDTLSRTITFSYDGNDRISAITDFKSGGGRVWSYAYTSGDLTSVTSPAVTGFSSGKATTYTYDGSHRLDTIADPKSQSFLDATYGSGKVTALRYGTSGEDYGISYDSSTQTTVTDREGNVRVVTLTADGQIDGVTEQTNRGVRAGEGDYTTDYTYNADMLITGIELPDGNNLTYAYDTGSARARSNMTSERHYNDAGNAYDYAAWTYESTHNLVKTYKEPRDEQSPGSYTITYFYDYEEATVGDKNGDTLTGGTDGVLVRKQYSTVTSQSPSITPDEQFRSNSWGQLTWWRHEEGETTTFEYYSSGASNGMLRYRTEGDGALNLRTELTYGSVGNIATVIDARGYTSTYTVNDLNQVEQVTRPISSTVDFDTRFEYDGNDNLSEQEIENLDGSGSAYANAWITTSWTHEILNRIASRTDEIAATGSPTTVTTSFTYDENRNLKDVTRPEGNITRRTWDERNLLFEMTRAFGVSGQAATEQWSWTPNRLVKTYRTAVGSHTTTYAYDDWDRLVTVTDAEGNRFIRTFDTASHVVREELQDYSNQLDPLTVVYYEYNERAWKALEQKQYFKTAADTPTDVDTTFEYLKDGRIDLVVDPRGNATAYGYDAARRLTSIEDEAGNTRTFTLDANGNVTTLAELDKAQVGSGSDVTRTTTYTYDRRNLRLSESRDPSGLNVTTSWEYDSRGNLLEQTDPRGNEQDFEYDGRNLLTKVIEDRIGSTRATMNLFYDDNGNLIEVEDDNSNSKTYGYDSLDRRTSRTNADSTTFTWAYNGEDRLTGWSDENGTVVTDTLDALGMVDSRSISRGTGVEGPTSEDHAYDPLGRLLSITDDDSTVTLSWDSLSRVYEESIEWLGTSPTVTRTVQRTFDDTGNVTQLTYPDGSDIDYVIDGDLDRIDQVKDGASIVCDYRYVGKGLVDRLDYLNGVVRTQTFDALRRISEINHDKSGSTVAKFTYAYDANSNVLSERRAHNANLYEVFTHDKRNQIDTVWYDATTSSSPSTWSKRSEYDWDGAFNLDQVINTVGTTSNTVNYTNNARNQYTVLGGAAPQYTPNGELKDDNILSTYKYDYAGRMVRITRGTTNYTFKWDGRGRRIGTNYGTEVRFTWGGETILEEITSSTSPAVNAEWVWGQREPLRMERSGTASYYHANRAGSVERLTSGGGTVVESGEYEVFGKPSQATSSRGNPFLWNRSMYDFTGALYIESSVHDPHSTLRGIVPYDGNMYAHPVNATPSIVFGRSAGKDETSVMSLSTLLRIVLELDHPGWIWHTLALQPTMPDLPGNPSYPLPPFGPGGGVCFCDGAENGRYGPFIGCGGDAFSIAEPNCDQCCSDAGYPSGDDLEHADGGDQAPPALAGDSPDCQVDEDCGPGGQCGGAAENVGESTAEGHAHHEESKCWYP